MPESYPPYGADPNRPNETAPWRTGQPGAEDPTMMAPSGWSPSGPVPTGPPQGGPPPVPPAGPPPVPPQAGPPPVPPAGPPLSPSTPPPWPAPPAYGTPTWQAAGPGWAPGPPQPPPRRGLPTWVAVAGVLVALLVVVGLVFAAVKVMGSDSGQTDTADGSDAAETTTSSPEATIPVADLKGLLPSVSQVQSTLQLTDLEVKDDWSDARSLRPDDRVSDGSCLGTQYTSEGTVYTGSGFTAMRGERLERKGTIVATTVTGFPSAGDAAALVDKSTQTWKNCAGKPLTRYFSSLDESESWMLGTAEVNEGVLHVLNFEEGGEGWACSHALADKTNVVIETLVCGVGVTDEGSRLIDEVLSSMTV